MESLALTVEEVMDVRRVLVKAEMEKFLQNKELVSSLRKGKVRWPGPSCSLSRQEPWVEGGPGSLDPGLLPHHAGLTHLVLRLQICCCCRAKFPLFSWPPTCLFCKR